MLLEDRGDRRPRHAMPQILQRALNAGVAPARILGRHPHGQAANLGKYAGPSTSTRLVRPFPGDEHPVPAKNRIGRDNRRHLDQDLATETGAEDRQPPPFVVGEPHALAAELSLQDSVLFAQVLDDLGLSALEPADKKRDEQLHRNHAPSLRQLPAEFSDTTGAECPVARHQLAVPTQNGVRRHKGRDVREQPATRAGVLIRRGVGARRRRNAAADRRAWPSAVDSLRAGMR